MGYLCGLKRQVVERLLQEEDFFLVVVHPGAPGVLLPAALLAEARPVGLHIGRRLRVPIEDLEVSEEGIAGTLSFDRAPFFCRLPWCAVTQVSSGEEHLIWVAPLPGAEPGAGPGEPLAGGGPRRPRLKLV